MNKSFNVAQTFVCAVFLFIINCFAENSVTNGSFEKINPDKHLPENWNFAILKKAPVHFSTVNNGTDGKTSIKIKNTMPKAVPYQYGRLSQSIEMEPDQEYIFSFSGKGDPNSELVLVIGESWRKRFYFRSFKKEWKRFSVVVKLPASELKKNGRTEIRLIVDRFADVQIDDVRLVLKKQIVLPVKAWQKQKIYSVPLFQGKLAGLKTIPVNLPVQVYPFSAQEMDSGKKPSREDLSARTAMAANASGLYFFAEVKDNVCRIVSGFDMWRGDSIQLRVDCAGKAADLALSTDLEITFSVDQSGKPVAYCIEAGGTNRKWTGKYLPESLCQMVGFRKNGNYFFAARLDWSLLKPANLNTQPYFGYTVVINDSDQPNHRSVAFLTPGLHDNKYSNCYCTALLPAGHPVFRIMKEKSVSPNSINGKIQGAGLKGNCRFSAVLKDASGKSHRYELRKCAFKGSELLNLPFQINLPKGFSGKYRLAFLLNDHEIVVQEGIQQSLAKTASENLKKLLERLNGLNKEIDDLASKGKKSLYLSTPQFIFNKHLKEISDRFYAAKDPQERDYYAKQIIMITPECIEMFDVMDADCRKLRSNKPLPKTWHFKSSQIHFRDGWPSAIVENESGQRCERPAVCAGYGHFGHIDRDMKLFRKIAANTVQTEIGPLWIFPKEGKKQEFEPDFTYFDKRYNPMLKNAWENDVKVTLLISPHYCPEWLLKKYPDMKALATQKQRIGFIKYELSHPKSKELIKKYLEALLPRIKNHPYAKAIHSICITNEPECLYCTSDNPVTVRNFSKWMTKRYGTVAKFNALCGKKYADFAAVAAADSKDEAASFAFRNFVREEYAAWHRMVTETVHKFCPGFPVYSKIMIHSSPYTYLSGIDPELWANFSDLNGNDNYAMSGGHYATDMKVILVGHEIQISSKKVSVINAENHIIVDGEKKPISNDHVYSTTFEQFVSGAATLTTWVYHDVTYPFARRYPKEPRLGCIYMRPGNLAAHARAVMDGMRLAPELKKFMLYEPDTAFLYSSTSAILDGWGGCYHPIHDLGMLLAATGRRSRALTERQIAAGNFGRTKLLFIAGSANLTREAYAGLKKFTMHGGKIVAAVNSLQRDEYGHPVKLDFPVTRVKWLNMEDIERQLAATPELDPIPLDVFVKGGKTDGFIFRVIPDAKNGYLVNLMNCNEKPCELSLKGKGVWYDLINEETPAMKFTLPPRKLMLLRFTPKNQK